MSQTAIPPAVRPRQLLAVALVLAFAGMAQAGGLLELSAGIHRIQAEVANSNAARAQGLMNRKGMAEQRGMLFVFPQAEKHCMWMRNTLMPLAVAFLDEQGRIINIAEMTPRSEQHHCAERPARYALEMNAGWFKTRGFAAGMPISGIDKAPAPQ